MASERIVARIQETEFSGQKHTVTERDYSEAVSPLFKFCSGRFQWKR